MAYVVPRPEAAIDPVKISVAIVIADIVHELARAEVRPICRICAGERAASHAGALAFGWLLQNRVTRYLELTPAGERALAAARQGRSAAPSHQLAWGHHPARQFAFSEPQ